MNNDPAFELALDEALQLLASGVSREECLRRFPHYAAEFEPLLTAAEAARAGLLADQPLPTPNLARGKRRFLEAARAPAQRPIGLLNIRWVSAVVVLLLVIAIGTGVASANALPGDVLYPVKRGLEAAQLALTFDPEARAHAQAAQAERRRAEAQQVLNLRRETRLEFEGVIEIIERNALQISGLRVLTDLADEFHIGDAVRVIAHTLDESLVADEIILLSRPTATPTPIHTLTATTTSPRPLATTTPTPTQTPTSTPPRPTQTRLPPTITATFTVIRPTQTTPTRTLPPTEARPTETATSVRVADSPTPETTATPFRPTPTGRP